jgi:type II secretory pathway pseudopilin PulG
VRVALAIVGVLGALVAPGLFVTGPTVKQVAADPGTQTTMTQTSAVAIKRRDGRTAGQIIANKANSASNTISCKLATSYTADCTATTTNIILNPGDALGLCDAGTGGCFGGSVSCLAVATNGNPRPVITTIDY